MNRPKPACPPRTSPAELTLFPGLNAVYDFAQSGTAREILLNQKASAELGNYLNSDIYQTLAGQADPRLNWNILEIHDWPRFVKDALE